jgi:hypothetical protein
VPAGLSSFPAASFVGNELCGAPLPPCGPRSPARRLSGTEVVVIVAGIALVSAVVCVALLYTMLRVWSNWRAVSVSNSDGEESVHGGGGHGGGGGKWGDGKYWKVGSPVSWSAEQKHSSGSETASVLHGKSTEAAAGAGKS